MRLYVHEARHTFMAHRCEKGVDRTIAELGAYGVEARLYEWLAYHSDPDFLTMLAPGPATITAKTARHELLFAAPQHVLPRSDSERPSARAGGSRDERNSRLDGTDDPGRPVRRSRPRAACARGGWMPSLSRGAVFTWQAVDFPGGVTYGIEIDALYAFGKDWTYLAGADG